jgi:hypothetical protein
VIVGVSDEGDSLLEKYVKDNEIPFPIARHTSAGSEYGIQGYPSGFIIHPNGKVVWKGHPGDKNAVEKEIEKALKAVRLTPSLPASLSAAGKPMADGEWGKAVKVVQDAVAGGKLSEADRKVADEALKGFEADVASCLAEADRLEKDKDYLAAQEQLQEASKYAGIEGATKATEALTRFSTDAAIQKELEAGKKVAAAQELERKKLFKKAWKDYDTVVKTYAGTGAAARAEKFASRIKEEGLYTYNASCKKCQKLGKGCPKCSGT